MDEEGRAAAYRLRAGRRRAIETLRLALLAPPTEPRLRVEAAWQPIKEWIRERRHQGRDDPQDPPAPLA